MNQLSKDAWSLRQEMEQIRCDLAGDVSELADDAKTLADYRYHVRQHPWIALAAAAAAGFVLVPNKSRKLVPDAAALEKLIKKNQLVVQTKSEINQKKGLVATAVSLAAAAAMRAAIGYASQTVSSKLTAAQQTPAQTGAEPMSPGKPR